MSISIRFLLIGAVYGLVSMILGMVMGAQENFSLMPVHAHLNLLGWIVLSLYGVVYKIYPSMGKTGLASAQFYVANLGILMLLPSLTAYLLGNKSVLPIMVVGELLTVATLVMFIVNLWKHRRQ